MSGGRLAGKAALVTGAGRGIGRAIALRLAGDGALVCVHYGSSSAAAEAVVAEIAAAGGAAFAVGADLRDPQAIPTLVEDACAGVAERTGQGGLDILVNNAGIGTRARFEDVTPQMLDDVVQINLKAPFLLIQAAAPRIRAGGRIVNIGSMASLSAFPDLVAYAPTKAGLDALTRALAVHLGPRGITVNAVLPGATATEMNPLAEGSERAKAVAATTAIGRVGQPSDIADVVAFLASDEARWVTGELIRATGGQRL
ncbi:SDR family NAD(P)-dependent oxidoreductase [Enterovirga rhinocerotis]|uniref:NAD(P)-dependent dehydrogenase (Short-subunit alcohol dehydrogenase family) n=1 Tax=Enterovirga rhinocerotis TaxID=1339210 RepID=A0A4R7C7G0_9HYPH|nr:SDR family oxidoreductase [Enterovirga rhinocerotis]TDR94083.1 NAD(P)-dependent dehydrogenase (short-subunit alcohol dehydrogenase family) [Enterovirga rhinocerotis]